MYIHYKKCIFTTKNVYSLHKMYIHYKKCIFTTKNVYSPDEVALEGTVHYRRRHFFFGDGFYVYFFLFCLPEIQ